MKTKKPTPPADPISATATTTVRIRIKGHDITLTKEEAQTLAEQLTAAVGTNHSATTRLRKAYEEAARTPFIPQWTVHPHTWPKEDEPPLDYTKFPKGTLLRLSTVDEG